MIPCEMIFNGVWESSPWGDISNKAGDFHYFITKNVADHYASHNIYEESGYVDIVPPQYVRLDVSKIFKQAYPGKAPFMDIAGNPIKNALKKLGVHHFITLEDRAWELSDYWATLEAVYLSRLDYENCILPRIKDVAVNSI